MPKKWYSYFVVADEPAGTDGPPPASPPASEPQRVSDLAATVPADLTISSPASVTVDLGTVYDAAKIAAPPHGYTVLKVAEMLRSEHIGSLPDDVKRKSIMVALDAAGVKVAEIVEDAVRRDRALDTYERVLMKSLDELRAKTAAENQQIEDEIAHRVAELRARIDENNTRTQREQNDFLAWQTRKHQEEDAIATAVSYFVSENPITRTSPAKDQGGANGR